MRHVLNGFTTGLAPVLFAMMALGATFVGGVFLTGALLF